MTVSECSTTPVEVNGVMACLGELPAITGRLEYDSSTGSFVSALETVNDKAVAAQVKDASGNVFLLF